MSFFIVLRIDRCKCRSISFLITRTLLLAFFEACSRSLRLEGGIKLIKQKCWFPHTSR